jgi:hypothetical protein
LVLAAVAMAACSAPVLPSPTPQATLRTDVPPEIASAILLRESFGLRADAGYVAAVAADPAATTVDLGIPLLPAEAVEIRRRFAQQEEGVGPLVAYGAAHPDEFGGLYIDQPAGGVIVLLFTGRLDVHARAVAALARGLPVRIVPCRYTEADLRRIQDDISGRVQVLTAQGIQLLSVAVDVPRNVVTMDAKSDVPRAEAMLESLYPGKLDATIYPLPGPWENVASGPGWRLVANGPTDTGRAYSVDAATDVASWTRLWAETGLGGSIPPIDLAREIVVAFGEGLSRSCAEVRLDGVTLDLAARLVYHQSSDPLSPRGCLLDLSAAHVFVVALDRAALPASPFVVQLLPPGVCDDCGSQARIQVTLD